MADLDVQPKSSRPWWMWLLLALVALALIFFVLRSCDSTDADRDTATTQATGSNTVYAEDAATSGAAVTADEDWNNLNLEAPAAAFEEVTDQDIEVRGNDNYAVYSLDETILFGSDQSAVELQDGKKLQQIATSMGKRFQNGQIRIYSYTDAQGSATYNKELAQNRAEAVRGWLVQNGNVSQANVSLHPVGEANPVATNATPEGRQQNRRVQIVARRTAE